MFMASGNSQYGTEYGAGNKSSRLPFSKYVGKMPSPSQGRFNEIPMIVSMFVPWLIFSFIVTMLSFSMHYHAPSLCEIIVVIVGIITGFLSLLYLVRFVRAIFFMNEDSSPFVDPTWPLVMNSTAFLALVVAAVVGYHNFHVNMQVFIGIDSMNTYTNVDPSRTRGSELMDAGLVTFSPGTKIDLSKSVGFKETDTYCVAPLTAGSSSDKLATYDFWAVGKNCCSGNGETDFQCGDLRHGTSGVRWVGEDERPWFRLAVQQAQSTHHIKSIHPLFFEWVDDAETAKEQKYKHTYRYAFKAILIHFAAQLGIVSCVAAAYSRLNLSSLRL